MSVLIIKQDGSPAIKNQGLVAISISEDPVEQTDGIPWVTIILRMAVSQALKLQLSIYNHSGIPIIKGTAQIEQGQQQVCFNHLKPLGIEAYEHHSISERIDVAKRIWSRRSYATIAIIDD